MGANAHIAMMGAAPPEPDGAGPDPAAPSGENPTATDDTPLTDDTLLRPYRVGWPTSFIAVVLAAAVTVSIAVLVEPAPDAVPSNPVVRNYLARNENEVVAARRETARPLPSPQVSAPAAREISRPPEGSATRAVEVAHRSSPADPVSDAVPVAPGAGAPAEAISSPKPHGADPHTRAAPSDEPAPLPSDPRAPLATRSAEARERSTSPIDIAVIAVVAITLLHGVSVGMLREALAFATLGATAFAVRVWSQPLGHWLQNPTGLGIRYDLAPWVASALIGGGALAAVATFAHVMRQGARTVGRGRLDRLGGAAVGVAEGLITAGLLLFVMRGALGSSHELLANSHAFALLESAEQLAGIEEPPSRHAASQPGDR